MKHLLSFYSAVLTGNPNVGKSTVFNALTGMKQHTGNWPGKTVVTAQGRFRFENSELSLTDLPGTYSLCASSPDEQAAREALLSGQYDCIIIVADASCLERNLPLILQITELSNRVVLCLNLMDEARKKHLAPDAARLSSLLGIPVIPTSARSGEGMDALRRTAFDIAAGTLVPHPRRIIYDPAIEEASALIREAIPCTRALSLLLLSPEGREELLRELNIPHREPLTEVFRKAGLLLKNCPDCREHITETLVHESEAICRACTGTGDTHRERDRRLDRLMTSRATGIPLLLLLLTGVFYLTIIGANIPSELLSRGFSWLWEQWRRLLELGNASPFLIGLTADGMLGTMGDVVSVMLPPMAIFFPLFALLEDSGYLPRVAFILDRFFAGAGTQGKQALTMMMGFGCNACGITGCRIIESDRERKIAALTNNFSPCNGRFPTLLALISSFLVGSLPPAWRSLLGAVLLVGVILLSILISLAVTRLLSATVLKGSSGSFVLELPPYRRPRFLKTILRSLTDKTLSVLGRAVAVALPAGAVIWLLANIDCGEQSILAAFTGWIDPFARLMGLDGVIFTAFLLGFPANETVLPLALMLYTSGGTAVGIESTEQLHHILLQNGWGWETAICAMLFTLMHFPCSTACITFYKEHKSLKWTLLAFFLPTLLGILCCMLVNLVFRLFG